MWSELLLATALLPQAKAPEKWWNDSWSHRRTLTVTDEVRGSRPGNMAAAEVHTLGAAKADGADFRILDREGKEVALQVLASGEEDRALVAFEAPYRGPYTLYFGNPAAKPPARRLDFKAGVMLEVRALGPGEARDWEQMQALLENSPRRTGRWSWPNLSLGFNPLGPWDKGIFLFTAYLDCPADGSYAFAVNSLDASFLLVDGRVAAEWPGWHDARGGASARHQGAVDLKKGVHKLEFVNAFRSHGACSVGWQRPGEPRIVPLSPEAFAGYCVAGAGPAEKRDGPAADFEWAVQDDLGMEGRKVTAMKFRALGKVRTCAWDFGDGMTGRDVAPLHVYLEAGTYSVAAEVDGRKVVQKVRVQPWRGHGGKGYERRIERYADEVEGYSTEGLSAAACFEMGLICHEARRMDAALRGFRAALDKGHPFKGEEGAWVVRLWELYRDAGKYDDALRVCDRDPNAAQTLVLKAEILYDFLDRAKEAEACCREALEKSGDEPTDAARRAHIRLAEFALLRGDREGARRTLEDVERSERWRRREGDFPVTEGSHSIDFEEYLRQGNFEDAFKEIEAWTWDKPTEILGGLPRHLRGRLFLAKKLPGPAAREFDRALTIDPKAPFADEALYWKASACEALGRADDARKCYERILFEFPESSLALKAKEKVK